MAAFRQPRRLYASDFPRGYLSCEPRMARGEGDEVRTIRIGSGAGCSGGRIEPAIELAEKGDIQYLVFECLGRTGGAGAAGPDEESGKRL